MPMGWPLLVIDLKDYFFSIALLEKDIEKFTFIVLSLLRDTNEKLYHRNLKRLIFCVAATVNDI